MKEGYSEIYNSHGIPHMFVTLSALSASSQSARYSFVILKAVDYTAIEIDVNKLPVLSSFFKRFKSRTVNVTIQITEHRLLNNRFVFVP